MAETKTKTTYNNTGGLNVRRVTSAPRKGLLNLDVLTNDSSTYSPFYFNVIRKPLELKLGGNIFEFSPPRNRFKLKSQILFEAIDSQNNPLAYEILPQKEGSSSIRMCIFVYDTNVAGLGIITLVGEALLDECGCPVPEEWEGKLNTRWTTQAAVRTDDVSDTIEYDTAPGISISETKIPWTYQTYEDVYNINPGSPGSPYTVSGSYTPTYNSETTNSGSNANDGKFHYTLAQAPDTQSSGVGTLSVYHGNLRFSSSMVGGFLYVSGGANHINGAYPNPHTRTSNFPAYHATISAVLNATTAEVTPAYAGFQYEIGNFYPTFFDAKNGCRITWTETSSSIAYTDPTAGTTTMTTVESTVEAHTSYIDLEITNLKPICGVTTDAEVFMRSTRTQGPLIKLTEFPIEPSNITIDDTQTTAAGNTKEFTETGVFSNLKNITDNWEEGGSLNPLYTQTKFNTSVLMDSAKVYTTLTTPYEHPTQYITFQQKNSAMQSFRGNTSYFIEFDAIGDAGYNTTDNKLLAQLDIYISGSGITPTDFALERQLGQYVGSIKNQATFQQYVGNSFEYRNENQTSGKLIFVLRQGTWYIRNIRVQTCPDSPSATGITPHTSRALIPMPALTKFNDSYDFEVRYKNKNTIANKISKLNGPIQFEGNDPNAFLASQPGSNTLSPWYHGLTALTSSKHVHISGNLYVSQSIYGNEFHTRVVTSSILFQEGDTIFGNTSDDTHEFRGNITASSISGVGGNISASGELYGGLVNVVTDNTVFYNPTSGQLTYGVGGGVGFPYSGSDHQFPNTGTPRQAVITGSLYISSSAGGGHVTASGNISSSGPVSVFGEVVHLEGTDPRLRLKAKGANHPGIEWHEDSTRKWVVYNDPDESDNLTFKNNSTELIKISQTGGLTLATSGGHITASGNIKATSYVSASEFRTTGHITASGNISASGTLYGSNLYISGSPGNITASGHISTSRYLFISGTLKENQPTFGVLVKNPLTGEVHYTGSYGGIVAGDTRANTDTDTTYAISVVAGDNTDEEKIRLTAGGDGSGTDDVVLEAGTGLSIAASGDKITFTNTVTNTDTVNMGDGFKIRDDDDDDVTLTENTFIKFLSATGTAGTNVAGSGTEEDPFVMTITSPDTDTNTTYTVGDGGLTQKNFTTTLKNKLDAIEASADVTDTTNVTNAGAVMDTELSDLAGVKAVTISTLQPKPSEGAFADGDKTKLDKHANIVIDRPTISGSLGPNGDLIRTLTAAAISGSSTGGVGFDISRAAISGSSGPETTQFSNAIGQAGDGMSTVAVFTKGSTRRFTIDWLLSMPNGSGTADSNMMSGTITGMTDGTNVNFANTMGTGIGVNTSFSIICQIGPGSSPAPGWSCGDGDSANIILACMLSKYPGSQDGYFKATMRGL